MFFERSQFEAVQILEANWRPIREELCALPQTDFIPWKERTLYKTGWDVFGLFAFGTRMNENCAACPQTTAALERIPGLVTAGFSSMQPGTHIQPHVGYSYRYAPDGTLERTELNGEVLRCHLGLIVPPSLTGIGCAMRVGEELTTWTEGQCVVFDDTTEHEAWNRTESTRVVLLIDFAPERDPRKKAKTDVSRNV